MKITIPPSFEKDYNDLEDSIKRAVDAALTQLESNPFHPSLYTRKIPGTDRWYCRVTGNYRMTFDWENDEIILKVVDDHDSALRRSLRKP